MREKKIRCALSSFIINTNVNTADIYRVVTMVVEYLGWVDLDLGCSTILLGQ